MRRRNGWLAFGAALALPCIPVFYLYSQNAGYVAFPHALAIACAMAVLSAVLYLACFLIFRNPTAGLVFSAICCISFPLLGQTYLQYETAGTPTTWLIPAVVLIYVVTCAIVGFAFRRHSVSWLCNGLTVVTALLFAFNAFAAVRYAVRDRTMPAQYKMEFAVDPTLPTPNIYWFHCDAMMGFDAMERYLSDDQAAFKQTLNERGFLINESAAFEGGQRTAVAMPALMCPQFYDTVLKEPLDAFKRDSSAFRVGGMELARARKHNELVHAFIARGYHTSTIAYSDVYFLPITERFYNSFHAELSRLTPADPTIDLADAIITYSRMRECVSLYKRFLPVAMVSQSLSAWINDAEESVSARAPIESDVDPYAYLGSGDRKVFFETMPRALDEITRTQQTPRLVLISFMIAHGPFLWDAEGVAYPHEANSLLSYPPQHRYAADVLLRLIDLVIERDPDALIVLQADHGAHLVPAHTMRQQLDMTSVDVKRVRNSVFSAVRIPEAYGGNPVTPIPPLDISRTLVNRYVGPNYELVGEDTGF